MTDLLRTQGLRKHFGEVRAVDGLDLSIGDGAITAIIGPNGAGKTTLINLLTGALPPDGGRVFFKGEDITGLPTHLRVRRGLCRSFQIMNIFPRLSVFQNLLVPTLSLLQKSRSLLSGLQNQRAALEASERLLREAGLWEKREQKAGELSHGDQRLLEMAIALAVKPSLCLLDEPTAGMNPLERARLIETIQGLSRRGETTFVLVEHDMDVVFFIAQRIIVMNRGRVLADGGPQEIKENKAVREVYLGEES